MTLSKAYDTQIQSAAQRHLPAGYDWRLFKAQVAAESSFKPNAVSHCGAIGLVQVMPDTFAQWGTGDPFDPVANLNAGARYMTWLLGQWKAPRPQQDRENLALASYNAGLGNILEAQKLANNAWAYDTIMRELHRVTGHKSAEPINYVYRIREFYSTLLI